MVSTSLSLLPVSNVSSALDSVQHLTYLFTKTAIDSNYIFTYLEMQDRIESHQSKTGSHWLQVSKELVYEIGYNLSI